MEKYIGKSVYKGTAIGPINVLKKSDGIVKRQHVEDVAAELQRLEDVLLSGTQVSLRYAGMLLKLDKALAS